MRLDDITQRGFETVVDKMGLAKLIPRVNYTLPPAERQRKSERSKTISDSFSIPADEFDYIAKRELWDGYVEVLIVRTLLKIKAAAKKRRTRIKFFRFNTPTTTPNRRVLVFEKDGIFAVLVAHRLVYPTHKERGSEVVEFTFRVVVGEFDKEK